MLCAEKFTQNVEMYKNTNIYVCKNQKFTGNLFENRVEMFGNLIFFRVLEVRRKNTIRV